MKENKGKELLKILQENYEIETPQDLSSAIKDLFKDSLQEMMNAEFDSSMGYSKYDKKTEKTNYRNGVSKKTLKSEFGEFDFETPRDRNNEFEPKLVPKNENNNVNVSLKNSTINYKGLISTDIVTNSNDWKLPGSGEVFYGELLIIEKMLSNNLDNPIKYLIIDEPETFLHPSLYINMCSLLKKISNNVKVIISTHSPLILKYFIDELNEIIVVSKGNLNQLKPSRDYICIKDDIDLYSKSNCYKTTKKALEHFENYFEVFIKPVIFECLFSRVVIIGEGLGEQIIFECFKNKYLNFSKISSASFITLYGKDFMPLSINIIKDIGLEVVVIYDKDSNKSKDNEINNFINEFIEKNVEHRIGFNIDLEERLGIQKENDGTFKSIVVPSEIRNLYLNNGEKILSLLQEIKGLIDKI